MANTLRQLFSAQRPGFVLQGGGTKPDGSNNAAVSSLEGEPGISNTEGTIAMALSSGPNSGTNQWFINLANNSSLLDGSNDGGPFTVFGNVIDGTLSVATAITQLQIINGSAENSNWYIGTDDGLPVLPSYSGSTTPSTVPAADLVTDNIVVVPAAQAVATYTAVSANTALVTASVTNGVLTLTPASSTAVGSTTVTATVTDLAGETASSTFTVNVQGPPTVAIGNASGVVGTGAAIEFPVTLSSASASATTFNYTLTPGTAPSSDFQATNTSITIPAGSTQASIPVNILGDTSNTAESFSITLSSLSGNAVFGDGASTESATGTIEVTAPALTPSVIRSTFPTATVVAGNIVRGGLTVELTNSTQALETGVAMVKLYASSDGVIDSSSVLLTTIKPHVHLQPGRSVLVHVVKPLPASLPAGSYALLVQTTDSANNITDATTGPTVQLAAPFVSLSASNAIIRPPAIKLGRVGFITVTLANAGNVITTGSATINAGLSSDGVTEAITFAENPRNLRVRAKKSLAIRLRFVVPATATVGSYVPFVSITQDGSTATTFGVTPITLEAV